MLEIKIDVCTNEEADQLDENLVDFNNKIIPFTQDSDFYSINRIIKNEYGELLAGIKSIVYCWGCLHIDVLWVKEEFRMHGLGTTLLREIESIAAKNGCKLAHLDTYDFQAKDFYLKQGYDIVGVLSDCPPGHKRYYMSKKL